MRSRARGNVILFGVSMYNIDKRMLCQRRSDKKLSDPVWGGGGATLKLNINIVLKIIIIC